MRRKYVCLTDTHLSLALPGSTRRLVARVRSEEPAGVFITGDVSNGVHVESCLERLALELACPVYFVLGNHDYHGRTFASVRDDMLRLSVRHQNLFWMTEAGVVPLSDEVGLIGTEGWYDARLGDPAWLRFTLDWVLIPDLFLLPDLEERLEAFRALAAESAALMERRLEEALERFQTVYLLTHFPPWPEATRAVGTVLEQFWLPYNTNVAMGKALERVMEGRKKKHLVVLAGHTHTESWIRVSRNIECRVHSARYYGSPDGRRHVIL